MSFETQKRDVENQDTFNNAEAELDTGEFGENYIKKDPEVKKEGMERKKYEDLNEKEKQGTFNSPIPDTYLSKEEIEERASSKKEISTIKERIQNFFNKFSKN